MSLYAYYKNTKIHYTDQGKGSAIVLLHGFLENLTMWNDITSHIVKKNRVVCIDLLGHGKSECHGYIHTMEEMAEAVQAVLKTLRLRKVTLVGHSMGGYVALAFADLFPDNVKGLCLMNSTAQADSEEKKINRDRAIVAVKQNYKTFVRISVENLFRPKNRILFKEQVNWVKEEALSTPLQGIVAALEGMKIREDREVVLRFAPYKKLLIIGKKDPVLNYDSLLEQVENTDVELVEFPDGHMSHIENRESFTYNLLRFIEK